MELEKTFMGKTWDEIMKSKSEREVGSSLNGTNRTLQKSFRIQPSPDNKTETEISKAIEIIQCDLMNKTDIRVWESIAKEHKAHCKRELKFLESLHLESFNSNCDCADCRTTIEILIRRIKDLQEAMK